MPIDKEKFEKWIKLTEEASPGPWESLTDHGRNDNDDGYLYWSMGPEVTEPEVNRANASFIAAAREAMPALLDEVERLRTGTAAACTQHLYDSVVHYRDERDALLVRIEELMTFQEEVINKLDCAEQKVRELGGARDALQAEVRELQAQLGVRY